MINLEENMSAISRASSSGKKPRSDRQELDESAELKERTKEKEINLSCYQRLVRIMLEKNMEAQRNFLNEHPDALRAEIDDFGNTIFHYIVQEPANIDLLKELVPKVSSQTLEKLNVKGLTALHNAACAGNTEALKEFAKRSERLLSIEDNSEGKWLPIYHAAVWGREETVQYLLENGFEAENSDLALLLELLIDSNLYDQALQLLMEYPYLATPDENDLWGSTVNKLATKSLAFESGRKLGFLKGLIYSFIPVKDDDQDHAAGPPLDDDIERQMIISTGKAKEIPILLRVAITIVPFIKRIHDQKQMHSQTLKIVATMISRVTWTYNKAANNLKEAVLTAARLGIHEFVHEVLKAYPSAVFFRDDHGHNIFLLAVLHRKEKVFNLIHHQVASIRDYNNYIADKNDRNILHLAGRMLEPPTEVPGAALQMQRELQWFTGVRDLFQPWLQEKHDKKGSTPIKLFRKAHRGLVEKGEKWMRETATSCSVVGALITTIVFAAAFTVPGGLNPNGIPVYLNKRYFRIFAVSLALALFASTTSVQTFLGMLTSRYAEDDFLRALPRKLIIGLVTLFLSSASMMVAFGAAFCIVLSHPWKWVIVLLCLLGGLPVTLFAWMQFPLLVDILISTCGPGILNPKKNV